MNQYEIWKNHPNLDAKLRAELDTLNEKQIEDAFYTNIEFGTAGMRGLLGVGCNRINVHTIRKANQGFANYINANGEEAAKRGIAIGYDN
ncbi:MAG: phospho-sugar mutase, partial [Erysipelotrichaceae bacterium]|nr:phospho-sugar mutase [Erysipelotrichaceae bacterium]